MMIAREEGSGNCMKAGNYSVRRLMEDVREGRVVLPDFQRSFVWHPDDVKDLLVSVLGDYYVGSMLYMDEPSANAPFKLRLVEGVEKVNPTATIDTIVKIWLDGQQRTSSLFYALYAPPLPLAGRKSPFLYFLDLKELLDENWEDAVKFAITSNRRLLANLEGNEQFIRFTDFHDVGALLVKIQQTRFRDKAAQIITKLNDFMNYEVQTIELARGTKLERVVETFERINRTGEPLAVSDLLVARLFVENIKLRQLISDAATEYEFLRFVDTDYVLKTICLMRGNEVRRKDILELDPAQFELDWKDACEALQGAFQRITDIRDGYGAFDFVRFAPFKTLLIPLAALLSYMKRGGTQTGINFKKIDQWYWATCVTNRFNEAVNTNTYSDFRIMKDWLSDDAKVPTFIKDFDAYTTDLKAESKSSAVYKTVMCLVVRAGAYDYLSGQPPQFVASKVEDDHIFPKSRYFDDSVLNRTLISSNQQKSAQDPGVFFAALENINGRQKTLSILMTHFITEAGFEALLKNDTRAFLDARRGRLQSELHMLIPSRNSSEAN